MKKTGTSMMFLTLVIVVLATFAIAADAQLRPGTNMPASTGFSTQGQLRQGTPTGAFGQGQAGGFAGGAANVPGPIGQQQGAGIWIGEMDSRPTGNLPPGPIGGGPGGPGTCQCIRAPCNCPGSPPGVPLPYPNLPRQNPPWLNQPVQGQPLSTLPASTGAGNVVFGNAAGAPAGTL